MKKAPLEIFAAAATALAEADGLSSGTGAVVKLVAEYLDAKIAFVARRRQDSSVVDIIGSNGLGAADFRRLESRLGKSSLWRIIDVSTPLAIDDLAKDAVLNFLAFGTGASLMIAVPITLRGSTFGLLALGFERRTNVDEESVIAHLKVVAAMIAHSMQVASSIDEQSRKLAEENSNLKHELKEMFGFGNLIANSGQMRQVSDQVRQVSRTNFTVLIRGESGTGKEFLANIIHHNSLRSKRPMIKVNCAAPPESLVESELFGHEKGSFPGAAARKKGPFEMADGGTLYLDNIADLPPQVQLRLVRVIREQEFERLGGTETIHTNVRLVVAANDDLEEKVADGYFRAELFDLLNIFTIFLPPLRERKSDILLLAEHFLEVYGRKHDKFIRRISTPAIDLLTRYHFPGNVRELENVIERAVAGCDSNVIHGHHLPPSLQTAEVTDTVTRITLASAVESFESDLIQDTLKSTRGNVARAAVMLDSTERILGYKIKKYSINARRFR